MEIRALGWDERYAVRDSTARAFGPVLDEAWERRSEAARPTWEAGRWFAGFDGDRIVATGVLHDMTQWWHGRPVSMAGVSAITVAPEDRGRGLGRRLMTDLLRRCAGFGHPLAMLYPATTRIYRSLGWEHAGAQHHIEIPAEALRTVAAERVPVRRAGREDAGEAAAVIGRAHERARDSGPVGWPEARWRGMLGHRDEYVYLAEDGFLSYHWSGGNTGLEVTRLVASSERTLRALWAIVGSGSSTAETVRACVSPMDPVLWLPHERRLYETVHRTQWMLRVVDAPAAIRARGYPAGVTAGVPLLIDDPQCPGNSGHWRLEIEDGEGRLERSPETAGAVRLGPRGLSALYAGVPVTTLRLAGLVEGGDAEALSPAFAATPFSLDFF
ncbi:GNAT family N-acetyltransferase [Actinomadura sp. KC345]|uniref:GNAT family N-acetyltransferase n=1 Tax=Actinomadura sp. KC345 TaxID=2530371 RepID=UPI0010448C52|nr:GNAT family N-acetyltransferase [Actinomadura sp. KC345]TDC48215.1 GNAT family N-acetyltransferase [Actinomadura sp. KC345]